MEDTWIFLYFFYKEGNDDKLQIVDITSSDPWIPQCHYHDLAGVLKDPELYLKIITGNIPPSPTPSDTYLASSLEPSFGPRPPPSLDPSFKPSH